MRMTEKNCPWSTEIWICCWGDCPAALFDSTVSVGAASGASGTGTVMRLWENRAANYFESGSGEIDTAAALRLLKEKQRSAEREVREQETARETGQGRLRMECRYLERDMGALQEEYEEKKARLKKLGETERNRMFEERQSDGIPDMESEEAEGPRVRSPESDLHGNRGNTGRCGGIGVECVFWKTRSSLFPQCLLQELRLWWPQPACFFWQPAPRGRLKQNAVE